MEGESSKAKRSDTQQRKNPRWKGYMEFVMHVEETAGRKANIITESQYLQLKFATSSFQVGGEVGELKIHCTELSRVRPCELGIILGPPYGRKKEYIYCSILILKLLYICTPDLAPQMQIVCPRMPVLALPAWESVGWCG